MTTHPRTAKTSICVAALATVTLLALPSRALAQQNKQPGGFRKFLEGLAVASAGAGSLVGVWQGGKTENNPIHGGYLNLSFTFVFSSDGSYKEAAYMGGRQIMYASGTYQQSGNFLVFSPEQCQFASPELGQVTKFFPIPTDAQSRDSISFSPLAGGGQLSLKDMMSGEDWGLKPARGL